MACLVEDSTWIEVNAPAAFVDNDTAQRLGQHGYHPNLLGSQQDGFVPKQWQTGRDTGDKDVILRSASRIASHCGDRSQA